MGKTKGAVSTRAENTIDWADLLMKHGAVLYRTACRFLGQADEAEDCVQDVFLELLARPEPVGINNWSALLRWMVARRSLDRLRSRRARRETRPDSLEQLASLTHGADEAGGAAEMLEWLRGAMAQLPPKRAQVFALRCFAEMSYDEIAAALGMERSAVGVILHEARQQLWRMLPPEWAEDRKVRYGRANT